MAWALILLFSFPVFADPPQAGRAIDRLHQILVWQIADELGLNPEKEKALSKIMQETRTAKEQALTDRNNALEALKKSGKDVTKKDAEKLLQQYEKSIKRLADLDVSELQALKKLLGPEQTARFLSLKEDVLEKLKKVNKP